MKREVIRVEPLSSYLENWKAPTSVVTRHGDTIYVSGLPPFDPATGRVIEAPIERRTELGLGAVEALPRNRRLVAGECAEVQRRWPRFPPLIDGWCWCSRLTTGSEAPETDVTRS
jgi:hypothetical protein